MVLFTYNLKKILKVPLTKTVTLTVRVNEALPTKSRFRPFPWLSKQNLKWTALLKIECCNKRWSDQYVTENGSTRYWPLTAGDDLELPPVTSSALGVTRGDLIDLGVCDRDPWPETSGDITLFLGDMCGDLPVCGDPCCDLADLGVPCCDLEGDACCDLDVLGDSCCDLADLGVPSSDLDVLGETWCDLVGDLEVLGDSCCDLGVLGDTCCDLTDLGVWPPNETGDSLLFLPVAGDDLALDPGRRDRLRSGFVTRGDSVLYWRWSWGEALPTSGDPRPVLLGDGDDTPLPRPDRGDRAGSGFVVRVTHCIIVQWFPEVHVIQGASHPRARRHTAGARGHCPGT